MKQPNSRHCFVCGLENPQGLRLEFHETGPGEVRAQYVVPEVYQGYPGVVHGGIVAAMLDEMCGRAHMSGPAESSRFMYTARLEIRYRGTVPLGQPLHLMGRALKSKARTATSLGEIRDASGQLLAEAKAVLVDMPDEMLTDLDLDALGWKVY
jgi:uncharacterized protein (TIGR00369 family)